MALAALAALALAFLVRHRPWDEASSSGSPRASDEAADVHRRSATVGGSVAALETPRLTVAANADPTQPTRVPSPPGAYAYPPGSQPLTEGVDPATTTPEDDPVDPENGVHVVFGPRRDVVHPPEPMIIDLTVLDNKGNRLPISDGVAFFRSAQASAAVGSGPSAPLVDDGSGSDRAPGDLQYTATYVPSSREQAALCRFRVFVEVAFAAPNHLGGRRYSTWLDYTPKPGAELDGSYSEALRGGSLVVGAGLRVRERGQYKVIASLYAADRATALVFAQTSLPLEPGERSVPLTFFGKILRDRGIDGPYVLRYLMVFQEFPAEGIYWPGVTVDDAYTTRPYRAAELSADAYTPPAPTGPMVTADSPSQQGKPPPLISREQYARQHGLALAPPPAGSAASSSTPMGGGAAAAATTR